MQRKLIDKKGLKEDLGIPYSYTHLTRLERTGEFPMRVRHSLPATMKYVQDINLIAFLPEDRENSELSVGMWRSLPNVCEMLEQGNCVTRACIYFGTRDVYEPKFCPFHFFGGDHSYSITPTV